MSKKNKNFRFWIPLDKIKKGKDGNGNTVMKLGGVASTKTKDADGESLDPSGFDISYLQKRGIINWNHNKQPDAIIGEPTKAEFNKSGDLYVESMLYPDSALANSVYDLAVTLNKNSSTRKLGYSIEGTAVARDPFDNAKVTKASINNMALTISPKNPDSIVDIIKGQFSDIEDNGVDNRPIEELINEVNILKSYTGELSKGTLFSHTNEKGDTITVDNSYNVDIQKSLEANGNGAPLKVESVDGSKPKGKPSKEEEDEEDELLDKELTKGQAVDYLFEKETDIDFNNIAKIINTMAKKGKISKAQIDQALEDIKDTEDALLKGQEEEDMYDNEEEDTADEDGEDGEDGEDTADEDGKVDKPSFDKKKKKKEKVEKSMDGQEDDNLLKAVRRLNVTAIKKFNNVGTVLKGIYDEMGELRAENGELRDELEKAQDSIDDMNENPFEPKGKGTRKAKPQSRNFEKGLQGGDGGDDKPKLSISKNKEQVLNLLDGLAFNSEKGYNPEMAKAMTILESSGRLEKGVIDNIRTQSGIEITI